jgi:hypothetical protein
MAFIIIFFSKSVTICLDCRWERWRTKDIVSVLGTKGTYNRAVLLFPNKEERVNNKHRRRNKDESGERTRVMTNTDATKLSLSVRWCVLWTFHSSVCYYLYYANHKVYIYCLDGNVCVCGVEIFVCFFLLKFPAGCDQPSFQTTTPPWLIGFPPCSAVGNNLQHS